MKISKSKQELARIISENGGWRDCGSGLSNFAAQQDDGEVWFSLSKPEWNTGRECFSMGCEDRFTIGSLIHNRHQTILSRAEYFHLYQAPDADGWIEWKGGDRPVDTDAMVVCKVRTGKLWRNGKPIAAGVLRWSDTDSTTDIIAYRLHNPEQAKPRFCDSVMRSIPEYEIHSKNIDITQVGDIDVVESKPTIEQLAADYRNAKDYANRKQDEADKANMQSDAALSQLEDAIAAIGFAITPLAATEKEPELVITDWRDLQVGDVVEAHHYDRMVVGEVCEIDEECHDNRPFRIHEDGGNPWWVTSKEFKFISRP